MKDMDVTTSTEITPVNESIFFFSFTGLVSFAVVTRGGQTETSEGIGRGVVWDFKLSISDSDFDNMNPHQPCPHVVF